MKLLPIISLLMIPLSASCTCQQDWVHAKDYQQLGEIDWSQPVNGLELGRAAIWSGTPLPWYDFAKIYLRNTSDKPLHIFQLPALLTNQSLAAVTQGPETFGGCLIELTIRDQVSGGTYFVYAAQQNLAKPMVLLPGQQTAMLPRLDLSLPQQQSGNRYSSSWSYHVHATDATQPTSQVTWSGDLQTSESTVMVN